MPEDIWSNHNEWLENMYRCCVFGMKIFLGTIKIFYIFIICNVFFLRTILILVVFRNSHWIKIDQELTEVFLFFHLLWVCALVFPKYDISRLIIMSLVVLLNSIFFDDVAISNYDTFYWFRIQFLMFLLRNMYYCFWTKNSQTF